MARPVARVAILMGSESDLPVMAECARVLEGYGVVPGVTLEGMRAVQERNADLLK